MSCVNFVREWRDLHFNINFERQIFRKHFIAIIFPLKVFAGNLLRGSCQEMCELCEHTMNVPSKATNTFESYSDARTVLNAETNVRHILSENSPSITKISPDKNL